MQANIPSGAERLEAQIGSVAVYATAADLVAYQRTRSERLMRTLLTLVGSWLAVPVAFLIPPHLETAVLVFFIGLYFARRAWVGEWEVVSLSGVCPRCRKPLTLSRGSVLYLPHSLKCRACHGECWLELGVAPVVDDTMRQQAMERLQGGPRAALDGQPPLTWSPAASDWRDRRRD